MRNGWVRIAGFLALGRGSGWVWSRRWSSGRARRRTCIWCRQLPWVRSRPSNSLSALRPARRPPMPPRGATSSDWAAGVDPALGDRAWPAARGLVTERAGGGSELPRAGRAYSPAVTAGATLTWVGTAVSLVGSGCFWPGGCAATTGCFWPDRLPRSRLSQ